MKPDTTRRSLDPASRGSASLRTFASLLLVVLLGAACSSDGASDPTEETDATSTTEQSESDAGSTTSAAQASTTTVAPAELSMSDITYACVSTPTQLVYFVADELGYLESAGLNSEFVEVSTGAELVSSIIGGSAQMSCVGAPAVFSAINQGDVDLVAFLATVIGGDFEFALSEDLALSAGISADSSVGDKMEALRGATLATTPEGGLVATLTGIALNAYGLEPGVDVNIERLDGGSALLAQFEAGRIDAFMFLSGLTSAAQERKNAITITLTDLDEVPEFALSPAQMQVTTRAFADEHADTVTAFTGAMLQAFDYIVNNREAAYGIALDRFPEMTDHTFDLIFNALVERGIILGPENFEADLTLYNTGRDEPIELEYTDVVDSTFAEAAS